MKAVKRKKPRSPRAMRIYLHVTHSSCYILTNQHIRKSLDTKLLDGSIQFLQTNQINLHFHVFSFMVQVQFLDLTSSKIYHVTPVLDKIMV